MIRDTEYKGNIQEKKEMSLEAIKEIARRNTIVDVLIYTMSGKKVEGRVNIPKETRPSDVIKNGVNNKITIVDGSIDGIKIDHPAIVMVDNCEIIVLMDDNHIKVQERE